MDRTGTCHFLKVHLEASEVLHIVAMHLSRTQLSRLRSPDHLLLPRRRACGVGVGGNPLSRCGGVARLGGLLEQLSGKDPLIRKAFPIDEHATHGSQARCRSHQSCHLD
jgi:hypothetical protein